MSPSIVWMITAIFYAAFYCWYVGFRKKITPEEAEAAMSFYDNLNSITQRQKDSLRRFLTTDDGKEFIMVNLLDLKKPVRESNKKLSHYQKIFLGNLLRKGGHPAIVATAICGNIENVASDYSDDWMAAGLIRYRSRRDLMEVLPDTIGSEHHNLKLESLERTFAFPASVQLYLGGPKLLVPLILIAAAALSHLLILSL